MAHKIPIRPFKIENNVLIGDEKSTGNETIPIGDLVLNAFKSKPDFVGQVDGVTGEQNTYKQMRDKSVKCALWLKKQQVQPGDIISICTHNHLDTYVPLLASLFVGTIANPWNDNIVKSGIQFFLIQCMPKIIFINKDKAVTVREVAKEINIATKIVVFDEIEGFESIESIMNGDYDQAEIETFSCTKLKSLRDTGLLLFSSGTTGSPKGAEIPNNVFMSAQNNDILVMTFGNVYFWTGSLSWVSSVLMTVNCIVCYTKAIKYPRFEKEEVCRIIQKYKVTHMWLETSMCNQLFKTDVTKRYDLSSLKSIIFAGSTIKNEVHQGLMDMLPSVNVTQCFGMTELGGVCTSQITKKPGSCGYVSVNTRIMIVDLNTGKSLGSGKKGEIWCKSSNLMNCYYKDPETTMNAIDKNGWLHTGDLGYYDEDGDVFVIDRIKRLIKYKDYQVSPKDIESLLQEHPEVVDVVVMAVLHDIDLEHPIAFVTKLPGAKVTEKELIQLVAENMDDYHRLRKGVVFLKEMPRLASGKIDLQQLQKLAKTYQD